MPESLILWPFAVAWALAVLAGLSIAVDDALARRWSE